METRSALRTSWSAEESQASVWPLCFPAARKGPGRPAWSSGHRGLAENKRQTDRRPDTGQASRLVPAPGKALRAVDSGETARPALVSVKWQEEKFAFIISSFYKGKHPTFVLAKRRREFWGSFGAGCIRGVGGLGLVVGLGVKSPGLLAPSCHPAVLCDTALGVGGGGRASHFRR